ncbi:MAG: hypothetical protein ABIF85_05935 [Nanoarchaeota archaeon]|nr:hypothetical protein [Nanoarchaeota archaeon]MBU4300305.1 hypothetical protein [Nanoarchaeota archaeon]MBU4452048.1 hypothetical protein [Nanoarchaeota archaeon]MCG2723187.1 hypothetical protein [archaeon]
MTVLTFKYLRELQKSERDASTLQKIESSFYAACSKCLDSDSTEAESIRPLVKSILDTRERKIVTAALQSARADIKPENLLSEEETLFSKIVELLKINRVIINDVLSGKYIDFVAAQNISAPNKSETVAIMEKAAEKNAPIGVKAIKEILKIKALCDIPTFVAQDMNSYGPLNAGQTAEFPKKAAELLITAKMAEKTE